ncbi:MAG: hypothetical protein ACYTGB_18830, partial [Planctomycetota bacterium]
MASKGEKILQGLAKAIDETAYRDQHWAGTFREYLDMVVADPKVTRNAFQRLYDMILSYGTEEYTRHREKLLRYKFFDDPISGGRDAIFGLDRALMHLVQNLKGAALGYGAEKRIMLLHGPVGSSKSTIVRLLKKGLEVYTRAPEGALYTYGWRPEEGAEVQYCPMHEEPLRLVPSGLRDKVAAEINAAAKNDYKVAIAGDICPFCRQFYRELMEKYKGNWQEVVDGHIAVSRLVFSEKDRIGIGTFQPKDEKNQDSTELTGDINYRKIAIYGSDSDPRAFNFDGEFNIANRGLIEFIEVLKLDVAFLYDLLGASQEHSI